MPPLLPDWTNFLMGKGATSGKSARGARFHARIVPGSLYDTFLIPKDTLVGTSQDVQLLNPVVALISRRRALGALAGGGIATGIAATMSPDLLAKDWTATPSVPVSTSASDRGAGSTPFNYRLGASNPQVFSGGSLRTVTGKDIPALSGLSINLLEINPGSLRELHWHPNAHEINYCLEGEGTIGILSASGDRSTFGIKPGSITFVPVGDAHYIRNTGKGSLRLLIGFSHEEAEHLDLSQMLPWVPSDLLNQTLGVGPGTLPIFPPRDDAAITGVDSISNPVADDAATPFSAHLGALVVQKFAGGTVQPLRVDVIPKLEGMTLLKLDIDGSALREPHWHGNASEFNYCASGTAQVGIVAPSGESWTFVVEPGDVAYIPNNWFHYIASLNDEPLVFLAFFDHVAPNRVDLSGMTAYFPPEVLAASFGMDPGVFAKLPKRETVVIAGPIPGTIAPDATPST